MEIFSFSGYKDDIASLPGLTEQEKDKLLTDVMSVFARRIGVPVEEVLQMSDEEFSRRFYGAIEAGLKEVATCLAALEIKFPENHTSA